MAGLLEWFEGDDKVKDADGRTQADRREPYYMGAGASLGRIGGLLMAAGMPMHNDQRAQLMGQAGNAFGGIPGDIIAAREAQSKSILQQQTLTANRTKLANIAKVQAYASSPEGQKALAGLKPHEQFAAKVALDSGDVDAFSKIMNGVGTQDARAATLKLQEERLELARQKQEQSGAFKGSGIEPQMYNQLMSADPSSQEYLIAYRYFSKPRTDPAGNRQEAMDLSGYALPTFSRDGGGQPTTPDQIGQSLSPGEEKKLDNGTVIFKDAAGTVHVDYPGSEGREGIRTRQAPNQAKVELAPTKIDPGELRKLTELKVAHSKVDLAGTDLLGEWTKASAGDRAKSIAGLPTTLNAAWANFAALIKESAVFNLGVLTGGDRAFITQAISDPSGIKSLGADPRTVEAQIRKIMNILNVGIKTHERNTLHPPRPGGVPVSTAPPAAAPAQPAEPPAPAPAVPTRKWNPKTERLE